MDESNTKLVVKANAIEELLKRGIKKNRRKKDSFIKNAIKHKSYGEEAEYSTNFATLFNFNEANDVVIQQPYNGVPSIFGIMYKDYDTLFIAKMILLGSQRSFML